MEAIKCPNCGSEKVKGLTEEKYACLACDNVFLVHNLSKEFRMTDSHITDMHQDLKDDIHKLVNSNGVDEKVLLEKAEEHMNKQSYGTAFDLFERATDEFPSHSAGWYGMYRASTQNLTYVDNYAQYLCGGEYLTDEKDDQFIFLGYDAIKGALDCEDADKEKIKTDVIGFLRKCAEKGKREGEEGIRECVNMFRVAIGDRETKEKVARQGKAADKTKALLPAIILLSLSVLLIIYGLATDWVGIIIAIVGNILIFKFGGRVILRSFGKAKEEGDAWNDALDNAKIDLVDDMDTAVAALKTYCVDLNNYNLVLNDMKDIDAFFEKFTSGSYVGLQDYSYYKEDNEKFIFDFLEGKYDRFNYLL